MLTKNYRFRHNNAPKLAVNRRISKHGMVQCFVKEHFLYHFKTLTVNSLKNLNVL